MKKRDLTYGSRGERSRVTPGDGFLLAKSQGDVDGEELKAYAYLLLSLHFPITPQDSIMGSSLMS